MLVCGIYSCTVYVTSHYKFVRVDDDRKATEWPLCLSVRPPMKNDEFPPAARDERKSRICSNDIKEFIEWDVNVNIHRSFSFNQRDEIGNANFVLHSLNSMAKLIMPNYANKTFKIPKILHFIWSDEIIPSVFVENLRIFQKTHQAWDIHFWTLKSGRRFIQENEPQLLKTFDGYKVNVSKADALRYVLIYHIGGGYFDLDSKVIQPLDDLAEKYTCIIGAEPVENAVTILKRRSLLANSGFMCQPRHTFFRHVLDMLPFYGVYNPGPVYFTRCFNLYMQNQLDFNKPHPSSLPSDITIVPHDYFEYHVNHGVDFNMKAQCKNYTVSVYNYITDCIEADKEGSLECDNMFENVPDGKKMMFEACLEWISHGAEKREPSKTRYISHEHYGTYARFKSLNFSKDNSISKILPDISIHL